MIFLNAEVFPSFTLSLPFARPLFLIKRSPLLLCAPSSAGSAALARSDLSPLARTPQRRMAFCLLARHPPYIASCPYPAAPGHKMGTRRTTEREGSHWLTGCNCFRAAECCCCQRSSGGGGTLRLWVGPAGKRRVLPPQALAAQQEEEEEEDKKKRKKSCRDRPPPSSHSFLLRLHAPQAPHSPSYCAPHTHPAQSARGPLDASAPIPGWPLRCRLIPGCTIPGCVVTKAALRSRSLVFRSLTLAPSLLSPPLPPPLSATAAAWHTHAHGAPADHHPNPHFVRRCERSSAGEKRESFRRQPPLPGIRKTAFLPAFPPGARRSPRRSPTALYSSASLSKRRRRRTRAGEGGGGKHSRGALDRQQQKLQTHCDPLSLSLSLSFSRVCAEPGLTLFFLSIPTAAARTPAPATAAMFKNTYQSGFLSIL